jgi:hypothetical protein
MPLRLLRLRNVLYFPPKAGGGSGKGVFGQSSQKINLLILTQTATWCLPYFQKRSDQINLSLRNGGIVPPHHLFS